MRILCVSVIKGATHSGSGSDRALTLLVYRSRRGYRYCYMKGQVTAYTLYSSVAGKVKKQCML
jgi:hypothetical protein